MPKLNPDEKWTRFNKELIELMRSNDFFGLGTTYYKMAKFLEGEGKDPSHLREKGYEMKLRNITDNLNRLGGQGVKEVEILPTEDSCDACKKMDGKIFPLKEALVEKPIPVKECAHIYGCRCIYLPKIKVYF